MPDTGPSQELIRAVERVISRTFGGAMRVGEGEDLHGGTRTQVYRLPLLDGRGNAPATVIVKQVKSTEKNSYDPDSATIPAWTLFNEWASLQFLSKIAPEAAMGPRFYGGDRALGLIVMEDLGKGARLYEILKGSDPLAAESALVEYAALHGRLHAATIGKQDEYSSMREALGPSELADGHYDYNWLAPIFYQTVSLLDITPEPGVASELEALKASLLQPQPFRAFLQGDSCTDNCLFSGSALRLIDFEGGTFDHALKAGVYGRMHFPTCWYVYRLPTHIPQRMEAAYRAELVKGCPEAADDTLFYRAVTEMCVYWMIDWFQMVPLTLILEQDRLIAAASDRQRYLLRANIVAQTTREHGHMEAIGAIMQAMATKMQALWPDVEEMPYYPAFGDSSLIHRSKVDA